jgi:hypothetical protein
MSYILPSSRTSISPWSKRLGSDIGFLKVHLSRRDWVTALVNVTTRVRRHLLVEDPLPMLLFGLSRAVFVEAFG